MLVTIRAVTPPSRFDPHSPDGPDGARGPVRSVFRYPLDGRSASVARDHVRAQLRGWGLDELQNEATLLASELVTNAIRASELLPRRSAGGNGQPSVALQLTYDHHHLVVEVWDRAAGRPEFHRGDSATGNSGGLRVVNALAAGWGSYPVYAHGGPNGKVVWASLPQPQGQRQAATGDTPADETHLPRRTPSAPSTVSQPPADHTNLAILQRVVDRLRALDA